jgi:hypothetical protein
MNMSETMENWLFLDLNALKREIESEGHKWNLDDYCKGMINNQKEKLPLAYVDKRGNVFFNESALKFERTEEIESTLRELWAFDGEPKVALLTRSLLELA